MDKIHIVHYILYSCKSKIIYQINNQNILALSFIPYFQF